MTQHTPYDAEEDAYQEWLSEHGGERAPRTVLSEWKRAWRLGGQEGYLRAKAEDAPLLAAAQALHGLKDDRATYEAWRDEFDALDAAIATATKGE